MAEAIEHEGEAVLAGEEDGEEVHEIAVIIFMDF